jgi:hypothetical protein
MKRCAPHVDHSPKPWSPQGKGQHAVVRSHEWTTLFRVKGTTRHRCLQCLLLRQEHSNGSSHYHPVDGSPPVTLCPPCTQGKVGQSGG